MCYTSAYFSALHVACFIPQILVDFTKRVKNETIER